MAERRKICERKSATDSGASEVRLRRVEKQSSLLERIANENECATIPNQVRKGRGCRCCDNPGFVAWEELPSRQLHASLRSSYLAMAETGRSALVVVDDERPIFLLPLVSSAALGGLKPYWEQKRRLPIKCPMKRSGVFDRWGPP